MIMKAKILYIFCACLACCGLASMLSSCSDDNISDLELSGNCMIDQLSLDNFEGIIDLPSRSILVRLPEVYETSAMTITSLKMSDGAVCNVRQGETINMDAAKVLHVKNGDVYMDWTLSVLHDEARITSFVINDIYTGSIDQETKSIVVYIPATLDITNLVPTITYSQNAEQFGRERLYRQGYRHQQAQGPLPGFGSHDERTGSRGSDCLPVDAEQR